MSIYPVHLASWFPKGNEMHDDIKTLCLVMTCLTCGKHPKWKKAWGHHSLPWGHGDIWCDERCLKG